MGSKSEEFNAVKVTPTRIRHSAFSLASQLNLPPGCKLALNSVLATRVTTQGPPLVVKDGDTQLKMVPGFMRQSVTDTTDTQFVGMGAANPTNIYERVLLGYIHDSVPLLRRLKMFGLQRCRCAHVHGAQAIVGADYIDIEHEKQEIIVGYMATDGGTPKYFIIFGAPVEVDTYTKTVRGCVTGEKIVLRCGTNTQIVHNAGVSCRVKDSAITINVEDGDIMW